MFKIDNKGLTLVEVLIALALIAVIFALLGPFFVTSVDFFGQSNSLVVDQANLRKAMTSITREMRDANNVIIVSSSEVKVDNNTYYYDSANKSIVKSTASGSVSIAEYVTSFEVTRVDDLITIKTQAINSSSVIVTSVHLRSKPLPTATNTPTP